MKRVITLILALVMCLPLVACSGNDPRQVNLEDLTVRGKYADAVFCLQYTKEYSFDNSLDHGNQFVLAHGVVLLLDEKFYCSLASGGWP